MATITDPQNLQANGSLSAVGRTLTQTWDPSVCSDPTETIYYRIFQNGTSVLWVTTTSHTFTAAECSAWSGAQEFKVDAYAASAGTSPGFSNVVSFTYQSAGMAYYDGTAWVPCVVYYYDNGWQECVPLCYDNGTWRECGTT